MKRGDIYSSPFGNMVVEDVGTGWAQLVQASGNTGWTWSGAPKNMAENSIFPDGQCTELQKVKAANAELIEALGNVLPTVHEVYCDDRWYLDAKDLYDKAKARGEQCQH